MPRPRHRRARLGHRRARLDQTSDEQRGEQKPGKVVHLERHLVPIRRETTLRTTHARAQILVDLPQGAGQAAAVPQADLMTATIASADRVIDLGEQRMRVA
jgi:hypothetical protein